MKHRDNRRLLELARVFATSLRGSMAPTAIVTVTPKHPDWAKSPLGQKHARPLARAIREQAVERVVLAMHERMGEALSHEDLARVALLSPFHFNRVFRQITGVTPGRFLTAIRMREAMRLLLTTRLRVTDVCFEVGYQSLGTFTTRFGALVGVSPRTLRRLACSHADRSLASLCECSFDADGGSSGTLRGWVDAGDGASGLTIVGAFSDPIPERLPVGCAVCHAPGAFRMPAVPDGLHHVLAVAFPGAQTVRDSLLCASAAMRVGAAVQPVVVQGERCGPPIELAMRRPAPTDPPFVLAGPLLLAERVARTAQSACM